MAAAPGTAGTYYVAYERTHRGLPVVGGDFVVAVDRSGKVTGRTTAQERVIRLRTTTPTTTRAQARRVATRPGTRVARVSKPKLVVYAEGAPRLAWQTKVTDTRKGQPVRQTVWTDAQAQQQRHLERRRGQRGRLVDGVDHLHRGRGHLPLGGLRLLRIGLVHPEVRRLVTA